MLVQGYVPMELGQAVRFFIDKFPPAGFVLGRGETEEGEAEAPFRGNGIMGGFKLRISRDCPGWLELVMSLQEMPPPGAGTLKRRGITIKSLKRQHCF